MNTSKPIDETTNPGVQQEKAAPWYCEPWSEDALKPLEDVEPWEDLSAYEWG